MKRKKCLCFAGTLPTAACLLAVLIVQNLRAQIIPSSRMIPWQGNVGIPGGIPSRMTIYQTIAAGASLSTIQTALNNCPSNQVVYLSAGTYTINGVLTIPSGKTLRGAGPGSTILSGTGSGQGMIQFGNSLWPEWNDGTAATITSGFTKDSTNIVVSSTSGIAKGNLMWLDQLNDSTLVNVTGSYGTFGGAMLKDNARVLGQTVEVTGINGNTVSFQPAMYWTYSSSLNPRALSFAAGCQWAGIEDLTLYANNSGYTAMTCMKGSKYCWVKNIEGNFCDANGTGGGDHLDLFHCLRCEVRDSNFHDAYRHNSGTYDSCLMIDNKTSACLIENNIFYRLHVSVMLRSGSSGNVIAYNYSAGHYHDPQVSWLLQDLNANHGAHPMFNLYEGNIAALFQPDSFWGSSSHCTALRNWFLGDDIVFPPYSARGAYQTNSSQHVSANLMAVDLNYAISYYNLVGNIVGCTYGMSHDAYRAVAPASTSGGTLYLYAYGYNENGKPQLDSTLPFTTRIDHGNYDTANGTQIWDGTIADRSIPNSYYLTSKPSWFGNLTWPPFDPSTGLTRASVANIPAGYRFMYGTNPPGGPAGNTAPVAAASANPLRGAAPLAVSFSSAGSYDPEGVSLTYTWSFGNGATSTAANPTNTYQSAGTYSATLTVSDGVNTATATAITISVTNATGVSSNQPPAARASATPTSGAAPLSVSFSSAGSSDPEGTALTYNWTFGDGTTSTAANPSHTYVAAGTYSARLSVSDGTNATSASVLTITSRPLAPTGLHVAGF